jgi:hypothetical protein
MLGETLRSKHYWWLYLISAATGIGVWVAISFFTGQREAWDSHYYFTYGLPLMTLLAGVFGFMAPSRPWRWPLVVMAAQALVLVFQNPTANLLPLGLILFAALSAPLVIAAYVGSAVRKRF